MQNIAVLKLNEALNKAVKSLGVENFNAEFEKPKHEGHGDRAASVAMKLAKVLKSNPRDIANKIAENLKSEYIDKIEIAGAGFINVFLNGKFYADSVSDILNQGENYGSVDLGKNRKIQVEFVSANPTGPLHIGHGRGAAVGDSVARILKFTGWDVQREYYMNDSGLQIENLGKSTQARYFEILGHKDKCEFPENGYRGEYLYDVAKEIINLEGEKFLTMPLTESLNYFKKFSADTIMSGIKKDLEKFRVGFDNFFPEGYLHENNLVNSAMQELKSNGYAYEQDGALWFKTEDTIGDDKDRVLIRANGVPTYFASDIAYHRNKFITRNFEKVIDVWGADHHGYIARVKAAIKAMGKNPDDFIVLLIQLVNLLRDGKTVNMSTRSGEFVTLSEVLDETGTDAARFLFLTRRSDSPLDFDLEIAKRQTNENPVYYVQYAHARISGVMREFAKLNKDFPDNNKIPEEIFDDKNTRELADILTFYPDEISQASNDLTPHILTGYILNVAGAFHSFYNTNRIIDEPEGKLNLSMAAKNVIASCLNLLGVNAPERM
ncbi:MAG: arginine--tRNA ligase [Synergistaceae bacterium]|nr:arginine--tRNA ligase [Synergistaceae bacterium]MBR0074197.1 arginine--tRNA ligase [Synergistaceae bacterium]MBR0234375.1 arginine--tRNA ligase [Synergistaceae bacterium]